MRTLPGFVSASIQKSLDGSRVTNYAQWRRREDFEDMMKDPDVGPHMKRAMELGTAEPHLYSVSSVHEA